MTNEAYKTHFDQLSDLKDHVGKEIGLSEWIEITQDRVDQFADTTEDHQWIHINPSMSKQFSPYGTTIAHGFLVLSLAPKISYETSSIGNVVMGVNYGCDKVRFINATKVGAKVRGRVKLINYEEKQGGAKYISEITFELEGEEKPACVAELIAQVYSGPKEQAAQVKALNEQAAKGLQKENPDDVVLLEKSGGIATITLNRPSRYNAINQALFDGLMKALRDVRDDAEVRAVVLTGNGKGFCAGADMQNLGETNSGQDTRTYLNMWYQTIIRLMIELPKPIIGALNGPAAGAGTALALGCDFRVMEETASIVFAFINIGLVPDAGSSWFLSQLVGYSRALEITTSGRKVKAKECLQIGLTNKISESDQCLNEAKEWAKTFVDKAPLAIKHTKSIVQYAVNNSLFETIAFEAEKQAECIESKDHKEGVQAFVEKRPPVFKGQ